MRFKSLDVKAFNRISGSFSIPLDGQGIILVEGENLDYGDAGDSNGSGKSLVAVECLLWIGWGKMARTGDSPVTTDAMHPVFGADGTLTIDDYVFRRQRILKKATFQATRLDGTPVLLSKDPSKRREDIEDHLRMDYLGVRSAIVITDGKGGNLVKSSFGQQMAALESLLRMDELAKAAKIAADRASDAKTQYSVYSTALGYAEQALRDAMASRDKLKDSTVSDQLRAQIAELILRRNDLDVLEATLPDLEAERDVFVTHAHTMLAYQESVELLGRHRAKLVTIEQTLTSAICPTCKQVLKKIDRPALEREFTDVKKALTHVSNAMTEQATRIENTRQARAAIQFKIDDITRAVRERDILNDSIKVNQANLDTRELLLVDAEALVTTKRLDVQAATDLMITSKLALARATWWSSAYGRDGLQAEVFASSLPIVNDACARYAQIFFNGHVQVQFNPFREGRSDDLIRITGASAQEYDLLSEGEKSRVRLIAAFAMRALARWRLSEPINLSVYDEVFDRLDSAALINVARLLEQEASIPGATVIVVTHSPQLKALFPSAKVLRVTRQNHEATVRWV